jgi:fatty-acid desaturase
MTFLERVLDPPSYGYLREGKLYVPSKAELFREFFRRLNIFSSKKNWLPLFGWVTSLSFAVPLYVFITRYASVWLILAGFVYSMVLMGSHGTFWLHRYCTHRGFKFRNPWLMAICRNFVIRVVPEEVYVVSHYVHHQFSELPGDPYNVHAGWLYCFLADVNHQTINKNLTEKDYDHLARLMNHTGVRLNSYAQYQRWGSLCHPAFTIANYAINWTFWYGALYLLGGHALATAIFGWAGVWAIGIRTFNYEGHGKGVDRRRDGVDFNRADLSVNQVWPGFVAGEWHNNHHLYPNGARSGFLPYQLDLPWLLIRTLASVGVVSSYKDNQAEFYRDHYLPWAAAQNQEKKRTETSLPV